jgi:hypothetical protein
VSALLARMNANHIPAHVPTGGEPSPSSDEFPIGGDPPQDPYSGGGWKASVVLLGSAGLDGSAVKVGRGRALTASLTEQSKLRSWGAPDWNLVLWAS